MKIMIASTSEYKVKGISEAFRKFFPEDEIIITSCDAKSYVGDQPFNEEIFKGADNRIRNIRKKAEAVDYFVACESGIIQQFDNWFNVQVVLIENSDKFYSWGISSGFEVPDKDVKRILGEDITMKDVFDARFKEEGGIRHLSNNIFTRDMLIRDATVMALSNFNW